jgi:hypothetical protein
MRQGEAMEAYVQTVARNPERALESAGIQAKQITLAQFPHQHRYFTDEIHEDFFSTITWRNDVDARKHDAACLAMLMRLREGKHNSDLFRCGYVFVTRNATFAQRSREYCLQARLINKTQEGPVIHQRELATNAWLRTGLGAALDIPRTHLIATCDRVLRLRFEVQEAVTRTLTAVTPEKLEQFELLIQDHRSIRKLADATLNDERVVTADSVPILLEAMRQATIAEERDKMQAEYSAKRAKDAKALIIKAAREGIKERDAALDELRNAQAAERDRELRLIDRLISETSRQVHTLDRIVTIVLIAPGAVAVFDFVTGWLEGAFWWKVIGAVAGLIGLYHSFAHTTQRPLIGVASGLNFLAKAILRWRLRSRELVDRWPLQRFEFNRGQITRLPERPIQTTERGQTLDLLRRP